MNVPCCPSVNEDGPWPEIARSTGNQPMSRKRTGVRSSEWVRSGLMTGSIRRLGKADLSQWETDEPDSNVVGAYISARSDESAPARPWLGSRVSSACTGPAETAPFSEVPSA